MSAVEELARWCDENQEIILSALRNEGDRVKRESRNLAFHSSPAARAWAEDAASIEKARADFHDLMDRWFVESVEAT